VTKHRWIYHHVTLYEAALYAKEHRREERRAEYQRQRLYEVINGSLGGKLKADRSLLEDESAPAKPQSILDNWIELADAMKCEVPESVRKLAHG
jgi:hypothetical protein